MTVKAIVDLRPKFGAIRDQGKRPTCMAFAASDEHAFVLNTVDPLSTEYAYFHAVTKRSNTDRTTGVSLQAMAEAISIDGQPHESGWPYIPDLGGTDLWKPPDEPGELFYRDTSYLPSGLAPLYDALNDGHPIIIAMALSISFFQLRAGQVVEAPVDEPTLATHGVIVVGHGESAKAPCLLLRNSWGAGWGDQGYGWLMEDYLKPRLLMAGVMKI